MDKLLSSTLNINLNAKILFLSYSCKRDCISLYKMYQLENYELYNTPGF